MSAEEELDADFFEDGDYIVSKEYGRYLKKVSYVSGMTLYPGQCAVGEFFVVPVSKAKDSE